LKIKTEIDEYLIEIEWKVEQMKDSGVLIVFMDHRSYIGNNFSGRVDRAILNHSNGN
jgi:hypothetical protein